jgi:RimJ/RimL family protein N-acetyltransferase
VLSDLDFVTEMLADPVVMRYYPKPLTRVEAQAWIERQRRIRWRDPARRQRPDRRRR